jgi:hypothetical protein
MNEINKSAHLLFKQMFSNKIVQLESEAARKESNGAFTRQLDISKLKNKIELFIEQRAFGKFELRVLEKNADSIESYKYALVVKNYEKEIKDKHTTLFIITIDSSFTEVLFYQMSINNVIVPL